MTEDPKDRRYRPTRLWGQWQLPSVSISNGDGHWPVCSPGVKGQGTATQQHSNKKKARASNMGAKQQPRHSPFQVPDASGIEGIRGLAGESSSIYSCIQIYKALTPPAPPAYRGATEGPGPPSYVGSSEERPCPDLGLCAPPSAPAGAGAAAGG